MVAAEVLEVLSFLSLSSFNIIFFVFVVFALFLLVVQFERERGVISVFRKTEYTKKWNGEATQFE